jgi:hypothetical protein
MIHLLLVASLAVAEPAGLVKENKLPPEAEQALRAPGKVTLYSLEPDIRPTPREKALHQVFYSEKLLGQTELDGKQSATAIAELKSAIPRWKGLIFMCFSPRHALRVTAQGHTYDFLICYACQTLEIYRDGHYLITRHVAGSPKVLNQLLRDAKILLALRAGEQ